MSSEPLIRVDQLGKRYELFGKPADRLVQLLAEPVAHLFGREVAARGKEIWALREVSFELARGEALGVMGRNGSGKSTLLQMLCGTLSPSEGTLAINGRIAALLELGAGFNPEFTGRENVFLNGRLLGLDQQRIEERFDDICAFADIGPYIDEPTKTYSSGMFVRLAFAVATSVDADILVVDEALAVGDARFQARCMKRIRAIQDQGASVLFVSHDVAAVRTLCQRALWLDRGRVRELGPVLNVSSRYMESIFADDPEAMILAPGADAEDLAPAPAPTSAEAEAEATDSPRAEAVPEPAPVVEERPLAHWGEQVGLIRRAVIHDAAGAVVDVLSWGQRYRVSLEFAVPENFDAGHFAAAFSIKDLRGHDIVVSSTADSGFKLPSELSPGQCIQLDFEFENGLVEGKYFLVVALERRLGSVVEYYEYVEGIRYFSVVSAVRHFGIYQPRVMHVYKERVGV